LGRSCLDVSTAEDFLLRKLSFEIRDFSRDEPSLGEKFELFRIKFSDF
jgi:hypothetical protein